MKGFNEEALTPKEKQFFDFFEKKSKGGENGAVEVKVYASGKSNASSIYDILPSDGQPLDAEEVFSEVNEFIQTNYEDYPLFVIKVKANSKDKGFPIHIKGGKSRGAFGRNNNNNSMGFGNANNLGALGIVMQLMNENKRSDIGFEKFKSKLLKSNEKQKRKNNKSKYKQKLKKQKKKAKKKLAKKEAENSVMGVVKSLIKSPEAKSFVKGLGGIVLGDPQPSHLYKVETPIERTKVAGPPVKKAPEPKEEKAPVEQKIPLTKKNSPATEPSKGFEQHQESTNMQLTLDQKKAKEAIQLLENAGVDDPGDLMFSAAHYISQNLNDGVVQMLVQKILDHKKVAMQDLIID